MAETKRKRSDLLPCICMYPRGDTYVRDTELTPEERIEAKRRGDKAVSDALNDYFSTYPEKYHEFCQSDSVKAYDAAHPLPD